MSGASVGCSQPAPCPGTKPMRRCRNRGEKKNIIFIDVESDCFDNVIVIDVPESSERPPRSSKVPRKGLKHPSPRTGVICLDDDDNTDHNFANSSVKNDANLDSGASSSMRSQNKSGNLRNSSDAVGDECQFVRENACPVKLSKCKRTYSGKAPASNRYGLGTDSDSCPSDSDCPDCELMEDSFGKVREEWEKASARRKCDTRKGQSGVGDPDSISGNAHQNVDGANHGGHQQKKPLFEGKNGEGKKVFSEENANVGFSFNVWKDDPNKDDDYGMESILKTHFPPDEDDPCCCRMNPFAEGLSWDYEDYTSGQSFVQGGSSASRMKQHVSEEPSSSTCQEQNTREVNNVTDNFHDRQRTAPREPCESKEESYAAKANLSEPYKFHSKYSVCSEFAHTRSSSEVSAKVHQKTSSTSNPLHKCNSAEEKFSSEQASSLKSGASGQHATDGSSTKDDKDDLVPEGTSFSRSSVPGCDSSDGKVYCPDNLGEGGKKPLVSNIYTDKVQNGEAVKPMDKSQQEQKEDRRHDLLYGKRSEAVPDAEDCIVSEREKLKETDEYKRAVAEEWASRQRALQIQAEKAQELRRLRKRRKAESMRLLDMERRQKLRVEEIRETQKKDEENMNLKEVIRAQVIKELHELEVRCHDMTSLLQGLGTFVSNALTPSSNEVRAAYKRALLTFHPDRASRSDIRQQVEAEEKFKLISRMKEKFLPT